MRLGLMIAAAGRGTLRVSFLRLAVCLSVIGGVDAVQSNAIESLNKAIQTHNLVAVYRILDSGIDLNAYDEIGGTPLREAIRNNLPDLAIELIKRGASPSFRAALVGAAERCQENVVRFMLARGTPVNLQDLDGSTALLSAAWNCKDGNKSEVVRVLLDAGANPNLVDKVGGTPLIAAAQDGNERAVELLIKAGADLNIRDNEGISALYIARHHPFRTEAHKRIGNLLMKAGAK